MISCALLICWQMMTSTVAGKFDWIFYDGSTTIQTDWLDQNITNNVLTNPGGKECWYFDGYVETDYNC